jgi:hypothetical protein
VIVGQLNVVSFTAFPAKADAPLIVDANTVLSGAITREFFQAIAGRRSQIIKRLGGIEDEQLSPSRTSHCHWYFLHRLSAKETLGLSIPKAPDHCLMITRRAIILKLNHGQIFRALRTNLFAGRVFGGKIEMAALSGSLPHELLVLPENCCGSRGAAYSHPAVFCYATTNANALVTEPSKP